MIYRIVLLIVFCYAANSLPAQNKEHIPIASTVDRGSYIYIPRSALADTVMGILCQLKPGKVHADKRPIQFFWNSMCNDGSYNLTITPEQIYFSSSHDNPNPNFLFWVIDIDSLQYRQIKKGLQQKTPSGFENVSRYNRQSSTAFYDNTFKETFPYPQEWTDSSLAKHELYCEAQIKHQLERYFAILNAQIGTGEKLVLPSTTTKPKYFSYSRSEIQGWLPVRFEAPKP